MGNIDTSPFADIDVALAINADATLDLAFGNIPLDVTSEFLDYLATDDAQEKLGESIIAASVAGGLISASEALEILLAP